MDPLVLEGNAHPVRGPWPGNNNEQRPTDSLLLFLQDMAHATFSLPKKRQHLFSQTPKEPQKRKREKIVRAGRTNHFPRLTYLAKSRTDLAPDLRFRLSPPRQPW